jgi:hypothetical protein
MTASIRVIMTLLWSSRWEIFVVETKEFFLLREGSAAGKFSRLNVLPW